MQLIFTADPVYAASYQGIIHHQVRLGHQRYMHIYLVHHEPHRDPVRTVLYITVPAHTLTRIRMWLHQDEAFYGGSGQISVIF